MTRVFPKLVLLAVVTGCMAAGCVGTASRVDLDDEPITDIEAIDVDLRTMAMKMASSLLDVQAVAEAPAAVNIAFLTIENRTLTVDFDSYNLLLGIAIKQKDYRNAIHYGEKALELKP